MFNQNEKGRQAEFFSDSSFDSRKLKKRGFSLGRISISLSYENIFISIIGLIMLFIVCYSLGVERGKHLAQLESKDLLIEKEQVQKTQEIETPKPKKKTKIVLAQAQRTFKSSTYIQVASFRTDEYAKKEMERLKDKGYQPYALTWGKYRVVCVGGYDNKDQAEEDLKHLRELYADCILRNK